MTRWIFFIFFFFSNTIPPEYVRSPSYRKVLGFFFFFNEITRDNNFISFSVNNEPEQVRCTAVQTKRTPRSNRKMCTIVLYEMVYSFGRRWLQLYSLTIFVKRYFSLVFHFTIPRLRNVWFPLVFINTRRIILHENPVYIPIFFLCKITLDRPDRRHNYTWLLK